MDPAFIALIGTIVGGLLIKFAEIMLTTKSIVKSDTKKILKARADKKTEFDCQVYSDRLFEKKLVEAEVLKIEDMSVCEDNHCLNCKPTNDAKNAHKITSWTPGRANGGVINTGKLRIGACGSGSKNIYLPYDKKHNRYQNYQPTTSNRIVDFKGTNVFRPYAVTDDAKPVQLTFNYVNKLYEVIWESHHPEGIRAYKDVVSIEMFNHWQTLEVQDTKILEEDIRQKTNTRIMTKYYSRFNSKYVDTMNNCYKCDGWVENSDVHEECKTPDVSHYEVRDGNGQIIKTFGEEIKIHDPDTNGYLGSIIKLANNGIISANEARINFEEALDKGSHKTPMIISQNLSEPSYRIAKPPLPPKLEKLPNPVEKKKRKDNEIAWERPPK